MLFVVDAEQSIENLWNNKISSSTIVIFESLIHKKNIKKLLNIYILHRVLNDIIIEYTVNSIIFNVHMTVELPANVFYFSYLDYVVIRISHRQLSKQFNGSYNTSFTNDVDNSGDRLYKILRKYISTQL